MPLPFGESGPKGRVRCGTMLTFLRHFGKFVPRHPHPPLPHFVRWGTFPKGEGLLVEKVHPLPRGWCSAQRI